MTCPAVSMLTPMKSTDVVRRNSCSRMLAHLFLAGLWLAGAPASSRAAEAAVHDVAVETETAPVLLDGVKLFDLSGVSAYPASKRAQAVSDRIKGLAADASFAVSNLQVLVADEAVQVMAGGKVLVGAIPVDATREGVTPDILAKAYVLNLQEAITRYRVVRSPGVVLAGLGRAVTATLALVVILLILVRVVRRVNKAYERRYQTRIEELKIKSFELGKLAGLRRMIRTLGRILGVLVLLGLLGGWINYVLDQFVWTRPLAEGFDGLLLDPLRAIAGTNAHDHPGISVIIAEFRSTPHSFAIRRPASISLSSSSGPQSDTSSFAYKAFSSIRPSFTARLICSFFTGSALSYQLPKAQITSVHHLSPDPAGKSCVESLNASARSRFCHWISSTSG